MRLLAALMLVAATGAVCLLDAASAMPHVTQDGGGTIFVMREVEETEDVQVDVSRRGPFEQDADDGGLLSRTPGRLLQDGEEDEEAQQCYGINDGFAGRSDDVILETTSTTTQPPPPRRCSLKGCWRCCRKRGYNWGLCLWKRCHCYY